MEKKHLISFFLRLLESFCFGKCEDKQEILLTVISFWKDGYTYILLY